jgi:Na+-driven multidrug efflux pump
VDAAKQGGYDMRLNLKFDVMKDSPYRVLFCVTLPLAICSIISLFISPVTARLISRYVGESYFTCVALVNTVLMAFQQVVGAVVSAAWIKTAFMLKGQDESQKQQALWNAMYAIVGVQLTLAMLMILLVDPIFTLIHIPGEIYGQVKLYYCAYLAISALTGFISFVTTLINGFCSALGIFLIQLMGLLVNILCSFILLPVLPGSVVNPDAVGAVCRVLIGVTAILMLRKNGCHMGFKAVNFRLFREIFYYCAPMAVFSVISTLNRDLDKYLVGIVTDTETLAVYSNASKVLPFDIIMTSFTTVLLPEITRRVSAEKKAEAAEIYKAFLEFTYIATGILCCAAIAGAPQLM